MKNIEILGNKSNQFMLGANGMQELQRVYLHRGTKIIAFGYACAQQNYVVYDDQMNAVEIGDPNKVDEYDLENYFSPLQKLEDTTRPISKQFGIGFYYDESGELVSDEIIAQSLERAKAIEELRERVKERKNRENEEKQSNAKTSGEYQIIDYSEKAIALVGDTKAIKDQLKALGGRFNPKLTCGCGWIFPKTKEMQLRELLGC